MIRTVLSWLFMFAVFVAFVRALIWAVRAEAKAEASFKTPEHQNLETINRFSDSDRQRARSAVNRHVVRKQRTS